MLTPTRINVTIIDKDGDSHDFQVAEGANLLDIAQANDLEMEGALHLFGSRIDHFRLWQ